MTVYGAVSAETERAIELFVRREDAEQMVAAGAETSPSAPTSYASRRSSSTPKAQRRPCSRIDGIGALGREVGLGCAVSVPQRPLDVKAVPGLLRTGASEAWLADLTY